MSRRKSAGEESGIQEIKNQEDVMREQILTFLEKNSKIDLQELAIMLGSSDEVIANEVQKMEEEQIIC